jgi:hypothetical protein
MNRPGFWIFIILIVLWQVVSRLVERAAAKERERKLAEAARARQGAAAPAAPAAPPAAPSGADLAARRRAQIEELRRRRAAQAGVPAPAPVAVPKALRTAPPPVPPLRGVPVQRPAVARRRPPAPPAPPPAAAEPVEEPVIALLEESPPVPAPPARRPASILRGALDRQSLRRTVVLREILDAPVALRDPYTAAP